VPPASFSISIMTTADAENEVPTDTGINLTSAAARRLAHVLVTTADEADGWSAR
jgi:hypothetical protein